VVVMELDVNQRLIKFLLEVKRFQFKKLLFHVVIMVLMKISLFYKLNEEYLKLSKYFYNFVDILCLIQRFKYF